jgi:hypothetical protein
MRSNKDLTLIEKEALDVHTIINDIELMKQYTERFFNDEYEDNFNHKKFIATCKKNRKLRKKKKK